MRTGGHFADLIRQFEAKSDEEETDVDVENELEARQDSSHSNEQSGAAQKDQSDLSEMGQLAELSPALNEGPKKANEASLEAPSLVQLDPANRARLTTEEESASGMPN